MIGSMREQEYSKILRIMMLCYRVEDNTGTGPYGFFDGMSDGHRDMLWAHNSLPDAKEDFGEWDEAYRFACMTLEQLKSWFGKYLKELKGYYIGVYQCEDVKTGQSGLQVMFLKKTSKLVKKIKIR